MSDCIIWSRAHTSGGYGLTWTVGRMELAHRVAWLNAGREIPDGYVIHHTCRNKLCVNVSHLECMAREDHSRHHNDRKDVTHCRQGHEFTPENTRFKGDKKHRGCRECGRVRQRAYLEKNREKLYAKNRAYRARRRLESAA